MSHLDSCKARDADRRDRPARRRLGPDRASAGRARRDAPALAPGGGPPRPRLGRERVLGDGQARGRPFRPASRTGGGRAPRSRGAHGRASVVAARGTDRRSLSSVRRLDDLRRLGRDPANRHRSTRAGTPVSLPLEGVRVVEYAQYVAGPLCGVLLADLGADVVKVEPPAGDGYRYVMPAAPGIGRYFVPLNRGKRSVVADLKTEGGLATSERLLGSADVVLHNFPRGRAERFGLGWDALHAAHPKAVVGRITSFGTTGPLADAPAYDLVAQARAGLLTAHASPGDTVPVRAGGIPMADLTAGFLLATGVLAALVRARETGIGEVVDTSLLAAALAVQVQDLVWLPGEAKADDVALAD